MTGTEIVTFREDFQNSIKNLEAKYGLKILLGTIKYDDSHLWAALEAVSVDESGQRKYDPIIDASARIYLLRVNKKLELPGKIIGSKVFLNDGKKGKIVDFLANKRSYPLLVDIDGQMWTVAGESINLIE
jgi:hypothetical protein